MSRLPPNNGGLTLRHVYDDGVVREKGVLAASPAPASFSQPFHEPDCDL
jgi:hypothetical protein